MKHTYSVMAVCQDGETITTTGTKSAMLDLMVKCCELTPDNMRTYKYVLLSVDGIPMRSSSFISEDVARKWYRRISEAVFDNRGCYLESDEDIVNSGLIPELTPAMFHTIGVAWLAYNITKWVRDDEGVKVWVLDKYPYHA